MKVAFDHQIFTLQSYGGVSRYISNLINFLSKNNIDARAYTGTHHNNYILDLPNNCVKGRYVKQYPAKTKELFYLVNHFLTQTQINFWKPDIVHETYYSALPIINSNSIRVVTAHDMIHELFKGNFSESNKTAKRKREAFKRTDHILSISENTKKDLIDIYGIDKSKISVVHNGVDIERFQQQDYLDLNIDFPYILYVGKRSGYKNFHRFIEACSQSKVIKNKIKILAFGGGDFSNEELLAMKNLGFSDGSIKQLGGDDKVLASLYTNAICFVFPSLYEGFGLPPLEAMASGCPVVSSNTSSMPEVINKAGEFFNPSITGEICNAIERVINSEERRSELIDLGYKNVSLFSWDKCALGTINVYKNLTGSGI